MRNLALGIAWVALLVVDWKVAVILGAFVVMVALEFSGVVRTVRAAIAWVRRRRAVTPLIPIARKLTKGVSVGFDVARHGKVTLTHWHMKDGVKVIDEVQPFGHFIESDEDGNPRVEL